VNDTSAHRLQSVEIDDQSLSAVSRDQEQERQVAVFDLLEENYFAPDGAVTGPYDLRLSLIDGRLAMDIGGPDYAHRFMLSMSALRGTIKDYFIVCESYYQAIRNATPHQIEALDMSRRSLHNEGSALLIERLDGKIAIDLPTSRRLFTLICALHRRSATL
jgi:uncharacterized protein (UPF0262 family)